jgi:hypothetical protein
MALTEKSLRIRAVRCPRRYRQLNGHPKFATTAWPAGSSNSGRFAAQFDAWREPGNFAGRVPRFVPAIPDEFCGEYTPRLLLFPCV